MDVNGAISIPSKYHGWTPLHCACLQDDVAVVKLLIDRGALYTIENALGERPVKIALAEKKSQEIIDLLLSLDRRIRHSYRALPCTHKHDLVSTGIVKNCPHPRCGKEVRKWVQLFG